MANSLKHISVILADLVKELKLDNDKWERKQNESTTTLRSGDDGTAPTGSIKHTQTSNRRETDEL